MRVSRMVWGGALVFLALGAVGEAKVAVSLELNQEFFYQGKPLPLRISVRNDGTEAIANPIKAPLFRGLSASTPNGPVLEAGGKPSTREPSRPKELAPGGFYGGTVNVTEVYPQLAETGTYNVWWAADGLRSQRLTITIIPSYDPEKSYEARIDTDRGEIVMQFFAEQAPIAAKSFIDMAHAGFYDGLLFQEVRRDQFIAFGNPRFGAPGRRAFQFPAEKSGVSLVAGTLIIKPVSSTPPTNGPEIMVLLKPHPTWAGHVTVLGQVVKGLDVVQDISRVPNSGRETQPAFRPLEDIRIRRLEIRERGATP